RMGVAEMALDDVCQEVFLSVHRQLPTYTGQSTPRTWVFGFIINHVLGYHRSLRRKSTYHRAVGELVDPDTLVDDRVSAEFYTQSAEAAAIAHQALEAMPVVKRMVFVMAEFEGLSIREISRALNLNVNTVYTRLRSARRVFRQLTRRQVQGDLFKLDALSA
ncbi:MAG TPA: RNA polymerase sigma factor, partial [Polyangiaceae bacterium]|nr:RNA polymerase sigma factor [Polyangiaceae bacterium]